jgi:hypothetical protein
MVFFVLTILRNMKNTVILLLFAFSLTSCLEEPITIPDEIIGLAPVYATENWQEITISGPRAIENLGKIYYKNPYIFATERGQGIHLINNTDPENPLPVAFIQIAGNSDIAVRGQVLYANSVSDLVALDISNLDSMRVVDRQVGVFRINGEEYPENYQGFFECADPNLGQVVGWYETTLRQPQCWR